jgi:hypothetical protein
VLTKTKIDDIMDEIQKTEFSVKNGEKTIYFESTEEMNEFLCFREQLYALYLEVSSCPKSVAK